MLAPQLPFPADKGTRIRNFGLVRELSRRHDVSVLCFGDPHDREAIAGLEAYCRVIGVITPPRRPVMLRIVQACLDPMPDLARRLWSPAFVARLRESMFAWRWDVVLIEGLEMMPHWYAVANQFHRTVILDEHNAEWLLQLRAARLDGKIGRFMGAIYSAIQAVKLRFYEGRAIEFVSGVAVVSIQDGAALRTIGRPRKLAIVPNGVDTEVLCLRASDPGGDIVLFTGTMDFRPNVDGVIWFAAEVWPKIRKACPNARFVIAGRDPTRVVRNLDRRDGIEVVGAVRDMNVQFDRACVYVVPLRMGGGMRLKILEALARGIPVVSTPLGAEGIDLVDGRDAILASASEHLAAAVIELLNNPQRRRQLTQAGRSLVERLYDWKSIVPQLEKLIQFSSQSMEARAKLTVASG